MKLHKEEEIKKKKFMNEFSKYLYNEQKMKNYFNIIFLCIGTDKLLGDCFGPLVGSKLKELLESYNVFNINIYGTLENNINYLNVKNVIEKIKSEYKDACIIVVDAALSNENNIGKIYVDNNKTIIARGLYKSKLEVGDISIKAVVGKNHKLAKNNFLSLQNISLNRIMQLSNIVAEGIYEVMRYA